MVKNNDEFDVEKMAYNIYLEHASKYEEYVKEHSICEICKENPSIRINRWGTIKAACQSCLNQEYESFLQQNQSYLDDEEEYEYEYDYRDCEDDYDQNNYYKYDY